MANVNKNAVVLEALRLLRDQKASVQEATSMMNAIANAYDNSGNARSIGANEPQTNESGPTLR